MSNRPPRGRMPVDFFGGDDRGGGMGDNDLKYTGGVTPE